jgi:hypothetical protein
MRAGYADTVSPGTLSVTGPTRRYYEAGRPSRARHVMVVPVRAANEGCRTHFQSSARPSLSMLSLAASISYGPSDTCSASSVTEGRAPPPR